METIRIGREDWTLEIAVSDQGISFDGGCFRGLTVLPSPVFCLHAEGRGGSRVTLDSCAQWRSVRCEQEEDAIRLRLSEPASCGDISVSICGSPDETGISWSLEVDNHSAEYSVTAISYPTPILRGEPLHVFVPDGCGRAIMEAGQHGFDLCDDYPGHRMSMQYFAWWGMSGGIYLGVHDPDACMKTFTVRAGDHQGQTQILFHGIGAGEVANSFSPAGSIRWEAIAGDWYDATRLYADFVRREASWMPTKGRPDTPPQFKEIPYWICDYIPNSEAQRDARPMTLATVSERYGEDYWVEAAIALKERLGTPVAYHVYNWHEIPFNIGYPHFLPARKTAREGLAKLKEAGLYVLPYINAVSWEMDDADEGFEENFANVGIGGAVIRPDGEIWHVPYPQRKANGAETRLAPVCPSFTRWHEIIDEVARGIETALPVDGIYFDQVSAVPSYPCRNPAHGHRPGGGSYWSDGYRRMMDRINARKPADQFYFSESNAEVYAGSFDGFLTWVWTMGDDVPAFPTVYAGYIQMLGRYTDGAKRDDDHYFRYHLAEELLFGQQMGWLNAHVIYNEERMRFLEKLVHARYHYTTLFNEGHILRPPHVESDIPPVTSSGITMRQVVSGVWQMDEPDANGRVKTVLFVVNISDRPAQAEIRLFPQEYGVRCPEHLSLTMEPASVKIIEYGV
jgi:hypothetical protein